MLRQRLVWYVALLISLGACSDKAPPRPPPDDMVEVPAATITLGCDRSEAWCKHAGWRPTTVTLVAFRIDRLETIAARGTDGRIYPWGNTPPTCEDTRYSNACGHLPYDFAEVGTYPKDRSPYGVLDLAGNAPEWVEEPYSGQYDAHFEAMDAVALSTGIVRGDLTMDAPPCCSVVDRWPSPKTLLMGGSMQPQRVGFRCVKAPTG